MDTLKQESRVEIIATGTEKHVEIPEFYEETVEIEDRKIPGVVNRNIKLIFQTDTFLYRTHKIVPF